MFLTIHLALLNIWIIWNKKLLNEILHAAGLALSADDSHAWESTLELPRGLQELLRHVHSTKWLLIRRRQELTRSYKEVCAPVMERCR